MFDFLKKIIQKKDKPPQKPKKVQAKEKKPAPQKSSFFGLGEKLKEGLTKTRETLNAQFTDLFSSNKIDDSFYDELEMILLTADVGISATTMLIEETKELMLRRTPLYKKAAHLSIDTAALSPEEIALIIERSLF